MLIASTMHDSDTSNQHSHDPNAVITLMHGRDSLRLVTCSICLRVRMDREWVEAHAAIRTLRTFAHKSVASLLGALCDRCEEGLRLRRQRDPERLVA
jgi:hypothetical protein